MHSKYTGTGGHIAIETRLDQQPFQSSFKNSYKIQYNPELNQTFSICQQTLG